MMVLRRFEFWGVRGMLRRPMSEEQTHLMLVLERRSWSYNSRSPGTCCILAACRIEWYLIALVCEGQGESKGCIRGAEEVENRCHFRLTFLTILFLAGEMRRIKLLGNNCSCCRGIRWQLIGFHLCHFSRRPYHASTSRPLPKRKPCLSSLIA